jgi:hypothetical protein
MCEQRTCVTCGLTKDLTSEFFYPSKKHEGGFNTQCRKCNIAKVHAQEKARREANPKFDPNSGSEAKRLATAKEFERKREIDNLLLMGLHYCKACDSTLPVGDFYVKDGTYSGLSHRCKACTKESFK